MSRSLVDLESEEDVEYGGTELMHGRSINHASEIVTNLLSRGSSNDFQADPYKSCLCFLFEVQTDFTDSEYFKSSCPGLQTLMMWHSHGIIGVIGSTC